MGKELEKKESRYTDEQIAFALKQAETGTPVAEVLRRMGISEQTFYRWKKVYGGLGVGELSRPHTSLGWMTPVEYAAAAAAKAAK